MPSGVVSTQKPRANCIMYCNIPECNLPLIDEGLICPCGHVFCGRHKPWLYCEAKKATCGFYCLLCKESILDDRKVINLHENRHLQTNGRGLVGVDVKLAVRWMKNSVKIWLLQMRLQLKREVQAAKEAHQRKHQRLMKVRAETAAMLEKSRELKIYLEHKRQEEQQSRRQADSIKRRLHAVRNATDEAKSRMCELKDKLAYEKRRNAYLVVRLAQSQEIHQKLLNEFTRIRGSAIALREALARRRQRDSRHRQRHRDLGHDEQHRYDNHRVRESRSRSSMRRFSQASHLVPLPACIDYRYDNHRRY